MGDDKVYICCSRVSDPPMVIIEGSTKDICSICSEEVWISPATKQTKEDHDGIVLCIPCAMKKADESEETPEVMISEVQKKEIARKSHSEFHSALKKALDILGG
jgi:hypothetical protein